MKNLLLSALFIALVAMSCVNKTNKTEATAKEEAPKMEVEKTEAPSEEVNTIDSTAVVAQEETTEQPDSTCCGE